MTITNGLKLQAVHNSLSVLGLVAASYGLASAVLWSNSTWYSWFTVGSFLFFDWLDLRLNGGSNLGLLLRGCWKPFSRSYLFFLLFSLLIDIVLGRHIAGMWSYPFFTPFEEAVHVVAVGYPFAFFSVSALFRLLRGMASRIPALSVRENLERTRPKDAIASILYLSLFVGVAIPILNYFFNDNRNVNEMMVICCGVCAFSVAPVAYFSRSRSFLLEFLSLHPATIIACVATVAISGPLHEIPNTFAGEWRYQNMPFTDLEFAGVHILVLTVGWMFLSILGISGNDLFLRQIQKGASEMSGGKGFESDENGVDASGRPSGRGQGQIGTNAMALETWPEKVSKTIRIRHHWIFWIILPEVLFLGQFLLIRFQDSDAHGLTAFAIYLILLSYLALLMPFNARILRSLLPSVLSFVEDDEIAVRSWFHGELKRFFSFRRDFAAFLFVGPALCGSLVYVTDFFHHRRPWFGNTISDYYGLAVFILFCLFCSHYIRFSIHLGFFVKRLSTFPIKITIYQHPVTSVRALGKMMFVISLGGTGCLTIAYFGIFFSPLPIGWIVVFWMGLGGALLLCMFILPQYAIHRIMADIKHEKLESFAKHLETATTVALEDPSNENIERFEKLYNVQQYLSKGMHEWPFDLGALLTLFSAIILPLLAAVIQVLLQ